ncbi:hypothetical protein BJ508DRAFT_413934 [Ascobolus immersus RN42]|uniref:Pyridoxal phosphate homeostasis protein n=1 Tax=Ascobolus immersus RN42 TaxID=1160509 RepID=A0A3N4IF43_ASCIM|nr:hypothetical protein BJ508DRAFT_413934 [Ascobolus immersus RN42]
MSTPQNCEAASDSEMKARAQDLIANITSVLGRISKASSPTRPVRLVAVSKLKPSSDILALYNAREQTKQEPHFGENYVQELMEKAKELPQEINWHFIGGLQTDKCKKVAAIPNLYAVHSVDSEKKANKLSQTRLSFPDFPKLRVFVQVNTSGEESKSGVEPAETLALAKHIQEKCPGLQLVGLMTIGAIARSKDAENPNEDFLTLKKIRDEIWEPLGCPGPEDLELSMGMSEDYEQAIELGATTVRVGSTIFGLRPKKADAAAKSSAEESKA